MMDLPFTDGAFTFFIAALIFIAVSIGVLLILWIAMPFSVFGLKGLVRNMVEEQEKTNRLLGELITALRDKEKPGPAEKSEGP
ncbi:MAG: hypothetical protein K8I01_09905 [Candidatus Methylomirabilis sp.]|nr:hypothetical protein [Deltaproteobacteria bacterium]